MNIVEEVIASSCGQKKFNLAWFRGRETKRENQNVRFCPWNDLNAPLDVHIPHRHIIQLSAQYSTEAISSFCWRSCMRVRDEVRDGKSEGWKENKSGRFTVIEREGTNER